MTPSPIYPFTSTVTSSYVSGTVYIGIQRVASGSFELVNLGNPTVLFAVDKSILGALTATLSYSLNNT